MVSAQGEVITEMWVLSGLQHPVSDPPLPGRAEVWSRNTAELQTRLLYLLIMSNLLALQGLQSECPVGDLQRRHSISSCSPCFTQPESEGVTLPTHLITDSSCNVADLYSTCLSDLNASAAEISDAHIHPCRAETHASFSHKLNKSEEGKC